MIRGLVLQEDIVTLNVYTANKRVSKYMRENLMELQVEIDVYLLSLEA